MKLLKFVVFALVALLVVVQGNPLQAKTDIAEFIKLERQCVMQGGICMHVEDCEPGNRPQFAAELCPLQSYRGIQCCYQ